MTLDEFIESSLARLKDVGRPSNAYVEEAGWDALYVRLTKRHIDGIIYEPVLDLANLVVEEELRGTGLFTRLVERIRKTWPDLHIYVESVLEPRFDRHLTKEGYRRVGEVRDIGSSSYFLKSPRSEEVQSLRV